MVIFLIIIFTITISNKEAKIKLKSFVSALTSSTNFKHQRQEKGEILVP